MVLDGQLEPLGLSVVLVEETNWRLGKLGDKVDMLDCMVSAQTRCWFPRPQ